MLSGPIVGVETVHGPVDRTRMCRRHRVGTLRAAPLGFGAIPASPATEFKFGIAFEPVMRPWLESLVDIEMMHPADNKETFRFGGEAVISKTLAVRAGYDEGADEMKMSLGAGVLSRLFSREASFDYAATFTDHLGTVHRFSLTLEL